MYIWPLPTIELSPFSEVEEKRPVALVTSPPAWKAIQHQLHLPVIWRGEPEEATEAHWQKLQQDLQGEVVYAVGGGLAVDAAKYLAVQHGLPLVCLPTALSVDAFFTWASGVREQGCVRYLATKPPELVIIDLAVIAAAPASIRAAGICDVLSIATGSWDWRLAEEKGFNPSSMRYNPQVDQIAAAILAAAYDCAPAAGRGDRAGLKQLLDCLALEVQLCNQIGHSRPEEGSEHYFAYAVENQLGKGLPHGNLVGPGLILMAREQGQPVAPLQAALEACAIPLNSIPPSLVEATLSTLPQYVRHHNLPYGIAHELS